MIIIRNIMTTLAPAVADNHLDMTGSELTAASGRPSLETYDSTPQQTKNRYRPTQPYRYGGSCMSQQPLTAMLMLVYLLLMVPALFAIDNRLSATRWGQGRLLRKTLQTGFIIALTLLFFNLMTLLY